MPGRRPLADDHDGTAQPGLGDQAAEQASRPGPNRLPFRAVNIDPSLSPAGPGGGLVGSR